MSKKKKRKKSSKSFFQFLIFFEVTSALKKELKVQFSELQSRAEK